MSTASVATMWTSHAATQVTHGSRSRPARSRRGVAWSCARVEDDGRAATPRATDGRRRAGRTGVKFVIEYRLKDDAKELEERLIGAVFEELERVRPEWLRFDAYRLEDGV